MVLLVDSSVDSVADTAFRSMFAARKSVFIDLLKWNLPVLSGRYEIDQFDNHRPRHSWCGMAWAALALSMGALLSSTALRRSAGCIRAW